MGGSYPSAEVQSVYSTAPADWASVCVCVCVYVSVCVCVCVCDKYNNDNVPYLK